MEEDERFYPATPDETWSALRDFVKLQWGIKSRDEFTRALTLEARSSTFTSGQHVSAQVLPMEGGAKVRVSGAGKVRTQIGNQAQLRRVFTTLLDGVSQQIQAGRA